MTKLSKQLHTHFLDPNADQDGVGHHHRQVNAEHISPVSDLPYEYNPSPRPTPAYEPIDPFTRPNLPRPQLSRKQTDEVESHHILVAATGSVASVKIPLIVRSLLSLRNVEVQVVVTSSGKRFFDVQKLKKECGVKVWEDEDEWKVWNEVSDPVLHIELRRWAHLLLIAPLSANTMSALALGICNNLLTNTIRAWDPTRPIIVAPAMNTYMYNHPITKKQLKFIKDEMPWVSIINPIEKVLACKEVGMGGMAEWGDCVGHVMKRLGLRGDEEVKIRIVKQDTEEEEQDAQVRTGNPDECEDEEEDQEDASETEIINSTTRLSI